MKRLIMMEEVNDEDEPNLVIFNKFEKIPCAGLAKVI